MTVRQEIEKGFPVWFVQNGFDDSLSRETIWELLIVFSELDSEQNNYVTRSSLYNRSGKLLIASIIKNIKKILTDDVLPLVMMDSRVTDEHRLKLATHAKRFNGAVQLYHHSIPVGMFPFMTEQGEHIRENVDEWLVITTYDDGSVLLKKPIGRVDIMTVLNLNDIDLAKEHLEQTDKIVQLLPMNDLILYKGNTVLGFYQQSLDDFAWSHVYREFDNMDKWVFDRDSKYQFTPVVHRKVYTPKRMVIGGFHGKDTYQDDDVKFLVDYITEHVPEQWNWDSDLTVRDSDLMVQMVRDGIIDHTHFYFMSDNRLTAVHLAVLPDDETELNQLRVDFERGLAHMISRTGGFHPTKISTISRQKIWDMMFVMSSIHPVDMYHLQMKEVYRKIIRLQKDDVRNLVMDNARQLSFKLSPKAISSSGWETKVMDLIPFDTEQLLNVDIEQEIVSVSAWDLASHNHFDGKKVNGKSEQIVHRSIRETLRISKSPKHSAHWKGLRADEQKILARATHSRATILTKNNPRPNYLEQELLTE